MLSFYDETLVNVGSSESVNPLLQVYSTSFHPKSGLLVVGFSTGIFGLYTMPECTAVHTLSISQHRIHASAVNCTGEWLAFGSRTLGQLRVWEWQSESCKCQ